MIIYSEEKINNLFNDNDFISEYDKYIIDNEEINKLKKFIDSIELNKKYFRLELNKKCGFKKYKNKNLGDDTIALKDINSLLNKITDKNIDKIRKKISDKIIDKDYLTELIIENILEKCIIHYSYIPIYIDLIMYLYSDNININFIILNISDKIYNKINDTEIINQSEYLTMCDKNKKLDKLIGHSILITELEKKKIIIGKINSILDDFISILSDCEIDEEKYKCSQCLYNIFKSLYGEYILPEGYNNKLKDLIKNEKCMKIKFKYMDILERK